MTVINHQDDVSVILYVCVCMCVLEKKWIGCWEERREEKSKGGFFFWQVLARTEIVVVEEEERKKEEKKRKKKKRKKKNKVPPTVDRFFYPPFLQTGILTQNPKVTQIYYRGHLKKKKNHHLLSHTYRGQGGGNNLR